VSTPESLTIFTINGFAGAWNAGPQFEVGQHLSANPVDRGLGLATLQPIGYDCSSFPLSIGVASGLAELRRQRQLHPGNYFISAWSEGCCIATEYLKTDTSGECKGGAFFGNPYRAAGQWNPSGSALGAVRDPGGAGIGGPGHNWKTPDSIHHYCHGPGSSYDGMPGWDQYTCASVGTDGDIARIFYNFVFNDWTGAFTEILTIAEDLAKNAGVTLFAAIETAIEWIRFFGGQCQGHTNYTSHAGAAYLANVAQSLP
jgi:hypothetical protein